MKYNVTVAVIIYNSSWKDISRTLYSILIQENVNFEIIIADDASSIRYLDEVRAFFENNGFEHYKIIEQPHNVGTVLNYLSAIKQASGEYVKPLSPGDMLYNCHTLWEYYSFAKNRDYLAVFADAIYYAENPSSEHMTFYPTLTSPRKKKNFLKKKYDYEAIFRQLSLEDDGISGAVMFMETETARRTIEEIKGIVKYIEDISSVLLTIKRIQIGYLKRTTVWYQYGFGISTKRNGNTYREYMNKDVLQFWKYVRNTYDVPRYVNRVIINCVCRKKRHLFPVLVLCFIICPGREWRNRNYRYNTIYNPRYMHEILDKSRIYCQ